MLQNTGHLRNTIDTGTTEIFKSGCQACQLIPIGILKR